MTPSGFATNIVPVLQLIVGGLSLLSLALVWWQIRAATLASKFSAQIAMTDMDATCERDRKVANALKHVGVNLDALVPLSQQDISSIAKDEDALFCLDQFLGNAEALCAAISVGAVDEDYAYAIHGYRIVQAHTIFEPFIRAMRDSRCEPGLLVEFEKTALRWHRRPSENVSASSCN